MDRKNYERPSMVVVKIQPMGLLLSSGVEGYRSSYGTANEQSWGESGDVKELKDPNLWDD